MTIIKNQYILGLVSLLLPPQPGGSPLTIIFSLPLSPSTLNNYKIFNRLNSLYFIQKHVFIVYKNIPERHNSRIDLMQACVQISRFHL